MLTNRDGSAIGLDGEDDAKMDRTHRIRLVVQEANQPEVRLEIGDQLLRPLPAQAVHQRVLAVVNRVEVPAHADAGLAVQARIAAGRGALHEEEERTLSNDHIRNQLLVARIHLGPRARQVAATLANRLHEGLERGRICAANPGEIATARHLVARQNEDLLCRPKGHLVEV